MSGRFGARCMALGLALVLGVSTTASAANPTFTIRQTFTNGNPMNPNKVERFGATCSVDRNCDPRADLNGNGSVDVVDLLTFVQDYWP